MQMEKLTAEVRSFGGNPWTQFLPGLNGWDAIMLKNVNITDCQFLELTEHFPDAPPPPPAVLDELKVRGMVAEPEETSEVPEPEPRAVMTPSRPLTEAEMRRNRLHARVDRTVERGERRRRR